MDDEDELARLLAEFGLELSGMANDVPDDGAGARLDDTDELGDWE